MKQNLITERALELRQGHSTFAEKKKKEALAIFNSLKMPKEKEEDWRYTNIDKINLQSFDLTNSAAKIFAAIPHELDEKGIIIEDINTALEKHPEAQKHFFKSTKIQGDKFAALAASHFAHGFFLYIPKNMEIEGPIKIKFEHDGNSVLYNLIVVDSHSQVDIIEEHVDSTHEKINSSVTEIYANDNSKINFYNINNYGNDTLSFSDVSATLQKDASINWISACFGGKINRLKIDTIFNGNGSNASNIGIFMAKGKEHIDFTTNMFHNTTNTTNDVLVNGILRDESSSVYRGLIKIEKEAQKTNSYLANHILKLGDKTVGNSIPSLKIDANDVKASHGATVGQINEEHLFYLMSRGLPREEAQKMIIEGFFEPVIQKIPAEELREKIREMINR